MKSSCFLEISRFLIDNRGMKYILYIALLGALTHCASRLEERRADFEAVEIGMVKSEVLDIAGPPYWSDHKDGHDRWMYYMKPEARQMEKIIYFKKGAVVRKGIREKPILTAEEMEEIKKPKQPEMEPFTPSYDKKELRKEVKEAVEKEEKQKKTKVYPGSTLESL